MAEILEPIATRLLTTQAKLSMASLACVVFLAQRNSKVFFMLESLIVPWEFLKPPMLCILGLNDIGMLCTQWQLHGSADFTAG